MDNSQRPDGSAATAVGWILVVIGVLAALLTGSAETTNGWLLGLAAANLGVGLGVLLLSLGYLVRAIWFLPGRDAERASVPAASSASAEPNVCNWCERELPPGATTCTTLTGSQLQRVAHKVTDPVCRAQLNAHGVTGEVEHG